MIRPALLRATVIVAALAAIGTAQDEKKPRTLREANQAMHSAWLLEVMDGDVPGAVRAYTAIAANDDPNNLQRWVAVARLLELKRLGVAVPEFDLDKVTPAPLRPALAAAKQPLPVPVEELIRRATQTPELVRQSVSSESERLPALRPATAAAQEWVRDRLRARIYDGRPRPRTAGTRNLPDRARIERVQAADILQREIEDRQEQADSLRKFYFPEWRPPVVTIEATLAIARVRTGIDAWLVDKDASRTQQNLLRSLREAFDARAATDPAAALAFVLRMPLYADRLLGSPTGPGR